MRPLTYILAAVFLFVAFSVFAATKTGRTIELTAEEEKQCEAEGGCILISKDSITQIISLIELLQRQAKEAKGKSCA